MMMYTYIVTYLERLDGIQGGLVAIFRVDAECREKLEHLLLYRVFASV